MLTALISCSVVLLSIVDMQKLLFSRPNFTVLFLEQIDIKVGSMNLGAHYLCKLFVDVSTSKYQI